jgi:predicted O-methyltransferase YrrM
MTDGASPQYGTKVDGTKVALMKSILRRLNRRARSLLHPFPKADADAFKGFKNPLMQQAAKTKFYRQRDHETIRGWMTPGERQTLYSLARHMPGPITEIGPWVGLSTVAIAQGIRDSAQTKQFVTYDLGLTTDNFRPIDDKIGMFLPDSDAPLGTCSVEAYNTEILPVLESPGGQIGMLRSNLEKFSVSDLVEIRIGDFKQKTPRTSGFVFCDALHDMTEVETNGPALLPYLKSGSILACHDIGHHQTQIDRLRSIVGGGYGISVDSLFVIEIE